jgi:hypothetical protein
LNAARRFQDFTSLSPNDVTIGKTDGYIEVTLEGIAEYMSKYGDTSFKDSENNRFELHFVKPSNAGFRMLSIDGSRESPMHPVPNVEPFNVIYPYLSKRKVAEFNESVSFEVTRNVSGRLDNLNAKINRLCKFGQPNSDAYYQACNNILGFVPSTVESTNGQKGAYVINAFENILLSEMGEGVTNLLGLIVDLCIANDQIFLIEEPENDVHPQALKQLLRLIEEKAGLNQFLISTHSNIVTKQLGAVADSRVFRTSMQYDSSKIPRSTVELVPEDPASRMRLLEELGYEPFDYSQWKGWLILEESSAETIIREILIPEFAPSLRLKLRTYAAGGRDQVERRFNDLRSLFVFIHLEESYKNKAWVIIDAGEEETQIIQRMRKVFEPSGWESAQFQQFSEHDFEKYYPDFFAEEVNSLLAINKPQLKRQGKKELLEKVLTWARSNSAVSKEAFRQSADEVIKILKAIEKTLK